MALFHPKVTAVQGRSSCLNPLSSLPPVLRFPRSHQSTTVHVPLYLFIFFFKTVSPSLSRCLLVYINLLLVESVLSIDHSDGLDQRAHHRPRRHSHRLLGHLLHFRGALRSQVHRALAVQVVAEGEIFSFPAEL